MRVEMAKDAVLFGDDVGAEAAETDTRPPPAAQVGGVEVIDAASAAAVVRPSVQSEFKTWLKQHLGAHRGVLCAWPRLSDGKGLGERPSERILALNRKIVGGHSWWWLWKLSQTPFSKRDSYTARSMPGLSVYRLGGEPDLAFGWFPGGATYGIEPGVIDSFLHFGLSVSVQEFAETPLEPQLDIQNHHAAISCYSQLDAAANGIAPAIFANFLVHDADEFKSVQDVLSMPFNAVSLGAERCQNVAQGSRISGIVTVTQLNTFRLSDMLGAHTEMGAAENVLKARDEIMAATAAIACKIKQLAELKFLKLNMVSENIVFCPELIETETDESEDWELRGFGFRSADFAAVKGKPFLCNFDSRMCKRVASAGYDANTAFIMMTLVMLASVRAQFGDRAFNAMAKELSQNVEFTSALDIAKKGADAFVDAVTPSFQHGRLERDALPSMVMLEALQDFRTALRSEAKDGIGILVDGERPLFNTLLQTVLGTSKFVPADIVGEDELPVVIEARRRARVRWRQAATQSMQSMQSMRV